MRFAALVVSLGAWHQNRWYAAHPRRRGIYSRRRAQSAAHLVVVAHSRFLSSASGKCDSLNLMISPRKSTPSLIIARLDYGQRSTTMHGFPAPTYRPDPRTTTWI